MMYTNGFEELLDASPDLRAEVEMNDGAMITHIPYINSCGPQAPQGKDEQIGEWAYQAKHSGTCPTCNTVRSSNGTCFC